LVGSTKCRNNSNNDFSDTSHNSTINLTSFPTISYRNHTTVINILINTSPTPRCHYLPTALKTVSTLLLFLMGTRLAVLAVIDKSYVSSLYVLDVVPSDFPTLIKIELRWISTHSYSMQTVRKKRNCCVDSHELLKRHFQDETNLSKTMETSFK
jgi:hypothetical protein